MFTQDAEEISPSGAFAQLLSVVILEEREEDLITQTLTQLFEEARASEIHLIPIRALTAAIVDGRVHIACLLELEIAVAPPPIYEIRIHRFIIETFAVGRKCLIEPWFDTLIIHHAVEPPLVGGLMRANRH